MPFDNRHDQPGRRFAKGATWDDICLGTFGFVAHLMLFLFLGGLVMHVWPDATLFLWITGIAAAALLVVRGKQVGATTTKESILAIREAK